MRNENNRWIWRFAGLALLIAVGIVALCPHTLLARAGGGEGFSGGGGDGSGGGGGGSAIILELIIWLLLTHPAIGIPVLIVAGIVYYFTHTTVRNAVRTSRQTRGLNAMDESAEAAALAALQERDPSFNVDGFYQRVSGAFMKIQEAWCAQQLSAVRPFISDGVHERFRLQFLEQQAEGTRDRMSGISIEQVQLVQISSDNLFDTAVVRIDATAVDQTISSTDGRVISGSGESVEFAEYWSFLRRRGVQSTDKAGLIEGHCPNCGAPLELNAGARCQSCHALLRSGQYDWALTEITQESEWRAEDSRSLPGMAEIQREDPDFTLADMEDRVAVIFWRKVRADRLGKIDPLHKVAADDFCKDYQKLLQAVNGNRAFWGDCAVGSVQTLGLIPGAPMNRALVEIHWSGKRWQINENGSAQATEESNVARNLMVLERKSGIKTDSNAVISSAHCPQCGAPVTDDISDACSFCGAVLNDGSRGWVLVDMLPMSGETARQLVMEVTASAITPDDADAQAPQAFQTALGVNSSVLPPPPSGLLAWTVKTVVGSGDTDADEQQMLKSLAARQNVSDDQLNIMLNAARSGSLQTHEPESAAQAQEWLGAMVWAALTSGRLTPREIQLFGMVGAQYGLSDYDVKLLIKRNQQQLYSSAVGALRQRRNAAGG